MQLELEDGTLIRNPTREALGSAIHSLRVPGRSFAVLESGPGSYLQTAKNDDGSFELEYQDGDLSHHYRLPYFVDLVEVTGAFQGYLTQRAFFLQKYAWEKLVLNYGKDKA